MPNLGAPELLIVLVIVIVLFGVGRLGKVGGELGKGIREFRTALRGEETLNHDQAPPPPSPPAA